MRFRPDLSLQPSNLNLMSVAHVPLSLVECCHFVVLLKIFEAAVMGVYVLELNWQF